MKPEDEPHREFGYVDISSIDNTTFKITECKRFNGADAPSRARRPIEPADVLFSNVRTYLRNIAIVSDDLDADLCSTGFTVLRSNGGVNPGYLFRFTLTNEFIDAVSPQQTGTHYPATSDRVVMSQSIPLPPLVEQKRIVAKVEELLGRVGAARERLARLPALLKRFRQSVLAAACSGQLTAEWRGGCSCPESAAALLSSVRAAKGRLIQNGAIKKGRSIQPIDVDTSRNDLPEEWVWTRLAEICTHIADVDHNMPKAVKEGVKFISAKDLLDDGTLNLTKDIKLISESDYERLSRKIKPKRNDIIYSRIGACLGKARVVQTDERFLVSYSCCVIRTLVHPGYLARYLESERVLQQARRDAQSIGVPDLGLKQIEEFTVPLPSLAEQAEIVRRVEALFALADKIEARVNSATARVQKSVQSILAKAFRGELVPTEAELARQEGRDYEPAEQLLARIRLQRSTRDDSLEPARLRHIRRSRTRRQSK